MDPQMTRRVTEAVTCDHPMPRFCPSVRQPMACSLRPDHRGEHGKPREVPRRFWDPDGKGARNVRELVVAFACGALSSAEANVMLRSGLRRALKALDAYRVNKIVKR